LQEDARYNQLTWRLRSAHWYNMSRKITEMIFSKS
jgi:hypothetical protein